MTQQEDKSSKLGYSKNTVSGSVKNITNVDMPEENSEHQKKTSDKKTDPIIIAIEEYSKHFSLAQKNSIEAYKISRFPNLFKEKNFTDDVESKHPSLEMSDPTKLYVAIIEASAMEILKNKKNH